MFCQILNNKRTHKRGEKKHSYGVTQSCSQQLHFWFCHRTEIILHTSPGRSQRSLPLPDLYKLHILLCRNLFRGATDPKHRFFVIDTTALHWAHDLTTAFSVSSAKKLWCRRTEMGMCLGLLKRRSNRTQVEETDLRLRSQRGAYFWWAAKLMKLSFPCACILSPLSSQFSVYVLLPAFWRAPMTPSSLAGQKALCSGYRLSDQPAGCCFWVFEDLRSLWWKHSFWSFSSVWPIFHKTEYV